MKNLKSTKGITLIALVITIIVLLILAGVAIATLTGDNGVLTKAGNAKNTANEAEIEEKIKLAYQDYYLGQHTQSGYTFQNAVDKMFGTGVATVTQKDGGGWTVAFASGRTYDVAANGTITEGSSSSSASNTQTAYAVGNEVTVGGESFYVLEASDASQSTVTLLAKYNLNQAGTAQAPNASYDDTKCAFSSTNYWASAWNAYTDWSTKKLDINEVSGEVSGDAIYKAKAYATSKGGTNGRLLTYEEANSLKTSYGDMIWGKANQQGEGSSNYYLYYWLSSAHEFRGRDVWLVGGSYSDFDNSDYVDDSNIGVRPVITVSKSLVS